MLKKFNLIVALVFLSGCSALSSATSVQVTSPASGSTVSSPVTINAKANPGPRITRWQVYVDNVGVYSTGATATISPSISMSAGTHNVIVQAWSNNGNSASANLTLTVSSTPNPSVSVSISPSSTALQTGASAQFTASVSGTSNTSVTWLVNGIQGGNSTVGTISSSGLYTAPAAVPSGSSVTVTATSVADTTKSANASVSIQAAPTPVSVSISPGSASLQTGASAQFTASVSGTSNTSVTWLVNGIQGGNSTVGTISSSGLYTAPAAVPSGSSVTVTARSVADTTKSANASVSIQAAPTPVSVTISPSTAALQTGASVQFTASVSGSSNTSVTWLVNGIQGGNSTVGTISSSGLYTAPAAVPSGSSVTVTATSVADTTKSASASVSILAPPTPVSVSISPTSATVPGGQSKQFTASVTGTTNTAINWQVAGITGGNSTVGLISSTGLYTAPSCPAASSETVTARSAFDSNAHADATVTVSGSAPAGTGGNYYVATNGSDSNDGSACHPWATIQHASDLAQPGWTVHVAPGTYNVSSLVTSTSGTASARIRYISDTKWGAKIVGSGTGIIWEVDANYIDIVGFDMTGPNRLGIMIGNSGSGIGNDHILNNNIHDLTISGGCTSSGGAAIDTSSPPWGGGSNRILGNRVANIGASMIGTCNTVQGIYVGTANDIVENNIVSGVACTGIQQWHGATNSVIVNNTVFHSKVGIFIGDGDGGALPGGSASNYVADNIVVNNTAIGIEEAGLVGSGNSYVNNLVWNNPKNYSVTSASPVGTVSSDPLFVNYQADGSGDYHLQTSSPAIDKGTNQGAPPIDFDGGARPEGPNWDIGAYEEGATPAAWPWQ